MSGLFAMGITMNLEQRLESILTNQHRYATEGAAFGRFVGAPISFPKYPEQWTLRQLDSLRSQHLSRVRGDSETELHHHWSRIMKARQTVLGASYALRVNNIRSPSEDVKAEFLELEPSIARAALAEAVCFNHPDLALAGHDLYWACDTLVGASSLTGKMPARCIFPPKKPLCVSDIHELDIKTDNALAWPLGIKVIRVGNAKYLIYPGELGDACQAFQGLSHFWVSGAAGVKALEAFLEALLSFYRQSLLARVTIGITLHDAYTLTMESHPIEGVICEQKAHRYQLISMRDDGSGHRSLAYHDVLPLSFHRAALPVEDTHRKELVDHLLALWSDPYRSFPSLLYFDVHLRFVAPLAAVAPALSACDKDKLLQLAARSYNVVASHVVKQEDGQYRVTRHDLVSPVTIAVTEDVEFAIGLALAHEVQHPMRLSLSCGGR